MKALLLGLFAALAAGLVILSAQLSDRGPAAEDGAARAAAPASDLDSEALPARVAALEAENRALRERVAELEARADFAAATRAAAGPAGTAPSPEVAIDGNERDRLEPDARWYLARYVASFRAGGGGSEYYRLAVLAHALELVGDLAAIALDPSSSALLRLRLAEMLGDGMFAGHERAIAALLSLLRAGDPAELAAAAIAALSVVGDAGTGLEVERHVFGLPPPIQSAALELALKLAGGQRNAAIVRLLARAPASAMRLLLEQIDHEDMELALDAFRFLSAQDQPTRLAAAQAVTRFHTAEFESFVAQWAATEPDPEVRAALGAARDSFATIRPYDPRRMIGPPDAVAERDDANAWASASADMGKVWLELDYDPPRRASAVVVHQVSTGGAVIEVLVRGADRAWRSVWTGAPPTAEPVPFEVAFAPTPDAVTTVRLVLDTSRASGWKEVDAVQLLGPDGAAWASGARASSSYAWR